MIFLSISLFLNRNEQEHLFELRFYSSQRGWIFGDEQNAKKESWLGGRTLTFSAEIPGGTIK